MKTYTLKHLVSFAAFAAVLAVGGCKKKEELPPPPPPPTISTPSPTAVISVTPSAISTGDSAILNWRTTDATDVTIEGLGTVPTAGTRNVNPTDSTTYHLIARGPGGSTDATARLTVSAPVAPPVPAAPAPQSIDDAAFHQNVQDIFFDYDSYELRPTDQATISKDAAFLSAHPEIRIVIGGYCDERGSTDYNLALGENRATAVKQALTTAGISPNRVRTVSYGKEKQFCSEHTEDCWQQNRRGQFSVDR